MPKDNKQIDNIIPLLLLIARPGAGKSEIINYISDLDPIERKEKYLLGKIHIIDDFPLLWRWFEEDHLLSEMNQNHLYTDNEGYFKDIYFWDLLIKMINLEYDKFVRDTDNYQVYTVILEFSRGKQHGGYKRAFPLISDQILNNLSMMYVNVSWSESLRKNRKRFNPDRPDSILEHGIPDKKLEFMYSECDFNEIAHLNNEYIDIRGNNIPYAIFENEDDVTTDCQPELGKRLQSCLEKIFQKRRASV